MPSVGATSQQASRLRVAHCAALVLGWCLVQQDCSCSRVDSCCAHVVEAYSNYHLWNISSPVVEAAVAVAVLPAENT